MSLGEKAYWLVAAKQQQLTKQAMRSKNKYYAHDGND